VSQADDIIRGNQDARNGDPKEPNFNKYYDWGYAEGKRHVILQNRVDILEDNNPP
jgi:hypothetical protein